MICDLAWLISIIVGAFMLIVFGFGIGRENGIAVHHKESYDERGNLTCEICKELKGETK